MPPKRKVTIDREAEPVESDESSSKRFKTTEGNEILHYLVCKEGGSDKFYEISIKYTSILSRYGRTGSNGVTSVKDFDTVQQAKEFVEQIRQEKLRKGYRETAIPASSYTNSSLATVKARVISHVAETAPAVATTSSSSSSSSNPSHRTIYLESGNTFYEIKIHGLNVELTSGTKNNQSFFTEDALQTFLTTSVGQKLDEGYQLVDILTRASSTITLSHTTLPPTTHPSSSMEEVLDEEEEIPTDDDTVLSEVITTHKTTPVITTSSSNNNNSSSSSSSSSHHNPTSSSNSHSSVKYYLECKDGNSFKFYELIVEGNKVIIRYGRIGAPGNPTVKDFPTNEAATSFALKTVKEKEKKAYKLVNTEESTTTAPLSSSSSIAVANPQIIIRLNEDLPAGYDPSEELEKGNIVYVEGSGKTPYKVKKFNGGYSCTCPGWIFQIKNCGVQACSCKHLRFLRGEDVEVERCIASAGPRATSGDGATATAASSTSSAKNTSITGKLSLAHAWKSGQNPHGYFMSEKLDGMRAYWHGGKLWTRNGNVIHAPDWFIAGLPTEEDLDGELFLGRQQFDACMSIARRSDASNEWKQLKYVVFDCPSVIGGIRDRLRRAQELFQEYHPPYAVIHPQEVCQGEEHLLQELTRVEQLGGEGMMLRHPTAKHRGGRTNDLLKVKTFADDEGYVIDYEEGKGKYTGMVGSLICITKTGLTFKVGSGLSDDQRSYHTAPKKGTVITYKYFELTKDGIPRFPTFMRIRPDMDKSAFPTLR